MGGHDSTPFIPALVYLGGAAVVARNPGFARLWPSSFWDPDRQRRGADHGTARCRESHDWGILPVVGDAALSLQACTSAATECMASGVISELTSATVFSWATSLISVHRSCP